MKKLLSIILAVSVMMSVFCVVPVSAAVTYGTHTYPYMYEDFSTETTFLAPTETNKFNQTWDTAEGHNAPGSLKLEQTHVSANNSTIYAVSGTAFGGNALLQKGDKVEMRFWIKLSQALNPSYSKITLIVWVYHPDTGASDRRKQVSIQLDEDNLDWQQVTATVDFSDWKDSSGNAWTNTVTRIQKVSFCSGNTSNANHLAGEDKNTVGRTNPVFWIDDFELKAYRPADADVTLVSGATAFGEAVEGSKIDLKYTYGGAGTDKSVYRLLADNKVVDVFKAGEEIIVPATAVGKALKVEIIPFEEYTADVSETTYTGYYSDDIVTVNVVKEKEIVHALGASTPQVSYSTKAKITNNNPNGTAINAVLVLVCYAADGSVVDWGQAAVKSPATVGSSGDDPITVTVTAPEGGFKATVDYCVSYLLDCGEATAPTIFNTTLCEITSEVDSRS